MPPLKNQTNPVDTGVTMDQAFKLLVLIAALFALLYVALFLSNESKQRTGSKSGEQQSQSDLPYQKVMVADDRLPSLFPEDIPLEADVEIVENSSLTADDGDLQANRRFESRLTPAQNYSKYLEYLQANDWDISVQNNGSSQKLLRASKGYQALMVRIEPNPINQTTTVSLVFSETRP